jgi:signal transduction histidine kinase
LAIAKSIIDAHGGKIWLEETPGGGATFIFEISK